MATGTEWVIYVLSSIDAVVVSLTFIYGCHFVWKYIVKQSISKKFVNLFYIVACLLVATDVAIVVLVFINHSNMMAVNWVPNGWVLMMHTTIYVVYMLLAISTLLHITTGLKIRTVRNLNNLTVKARIWCNYIFCLFLLACTITLQLIAKFEPDLVGLELLSLCLSVLGLILLFSYIVSFLRLIECLDEGIMKAVNTDFERRNLKCQTIWIVTSLGIFTIQNIFYYLLPWLEHDDLKDKGTLIWYVATMMLRDLFPLIFTIYSHHQNYNYIENESEADESVELG